MERAAGRPEANLRCWSPVGPTASAPTSPASPPTPATASAIVDVQPADWIERSVRHPGARRLGQRRGGDRGGLRGVRCARRGRQQRRHRALRPARSTATVEDFRAVSTSIWSARSSSLGPWRDAGSTPARPGCIVNVTSMNGVAAGPNAGAYGASKAAIALLTSQMALEWGAPRHPCQRRRPGPDRRRHVGADLRRPRHARRPRVEDAARPTRHRGRRRRGRAVPGVRARRLHPRPEHPGRRGRDRLGDRPPAATALGRLGGSGRSASTAPVVVLCRRAAARPRLRRDRRRARRARRTAGHEVRTVAHPDQLHDGARRRSTPSSSTRSGGGCRATRYEPWRAEWAYRPRPTRRAAIERSSAGGGGLLAVHTALDLLRRLARVGPRSSAAPGDWCGLVASAARRRHGPRHRRPPVVAGAWPCSSHARLVDEVYGDMHLAARRRGAGGRQAAHPTTTISRSCGPTATAPAGSWSTGLRPRRGVAGPPLNSRVLSPRR